MDNYIKICGKKIKLTDEQVEQLKKGSCRDRVKLSDVAVGGTVKIGEYEFIVLERSGDTTAVICKDLLIKNKVFGKNNNYNGSNADVACSSFADEIADIIGADNLVEHTVDLTSDDGLKDYGTIRRRASLLTTDLYRRYVVILDKFKIDAWWWLATPYSTDTHGSSSYVKCVSPSGRLDDYFCGFGGFGVRPFCILKSNIFVSK